MEGLLKMQVIGLQLGEGVRTSALWTTGPGGSTAQDLGCWSRGEWKIPGVSLRDIRTWWMGVKAIKEFQGALIQLGCKGQGGLSGGRSVTAELRTCVRHQPHFYK